MDEHKTVKGIEMSLKGLISILETLPETGENTDLWTTLIEGKDIAHAITNRRR